MDSLLFTLSLVGGFLLLLNYYISRHFSYWSRKGIPQIPNAYPYGNLRDTGVHIVESLNDIYDEFRSSGVPLVGMFLKWSRAVLLLDAELIKDVMTTDFLAFSDRHMYHNERDDPLSANLFAVSGAKWKRLRPKMTPTFTSGKMKFMFPTVVEVSERLKQCLLEACVNETSCGDDIDIKEICARYSTDVIGTTAFGIECNTLFDANADFRSMGRLFFEQPNRSLADAIFWSSNLTVAHFLRLKHLPEATAAFFTQIVKKTVLYREEFPDVAATRKDFLKLLIELKDSPVDGSGSALTMDELTAQAFVFFIAGFETSSTLLSFCLYELAQNQNRMIQDRLRREIVEVIARHGGQLTYEAMLEMHYLDQVLHETLRLYPPLGVITRGAMRDYRVRNTSIVIPKGCTILIPVFSIHRDPLYYSRPGEFDPERFSADAKFDASLFLPFGQGPRKCIAQRFGLMQTRIAMCAILQNFRLLPSMDPERRGRRVNISSRPPIITREGGFWVRLNKIYTNKNKVQ